MKKYEKKEVYEAPECKLVECSTEGILCGSPLNTNASNSDFDIEDVYNNSGSFWD